jgi:hypothetical protein
VIRRAGRLAEVRETLKRAPVVSLLGPRQSGKTTLARVRNATVFDREDPRNVARLSTPMTTLEPLRGSS